MKNKLKVGVLSLGCPRNLADTENILGRLNLNNHSVVDIEKADIAIVNTCAFIEEAKAESIDAILALVNLKKEGRLKKIVVCGCLPQRYGNTLFKELPEIDAFIGTPSLNHSSRRFRLTPKHYAYLKICESCINHCSYCIIPKIKGRFTSLDIGSVLNKISVFDREKIPELNIIGQDTSGYGLDLYGKRALPKLLSEILKKSKNIGWFRLLYLYPGGVIDSLLEIMEDNPRLCKYIDLPLQHINQRLLKLMRRNGTKKEILALIAKIRKRVPDAAIRTSLIVGFPSETEKNFEELLQFIREIRFERLGAFIYSREEGTPAYNFSGQVPQKIKINRLNAVMSLQQEISRENNSKFLGKTMDILIDEKEEGHYLGRSQYDAPEVDGLVYVSSGKKLNPGDFVKVKITDTLEYDLVGEAL